MSTPDYRTVVQTHYFQEFERRRELNSNLSIIIGLLGLVSAGLATMMKDLKPPLTGAEIWLAIGLFLSVLAIAVAVYQTIQAFVGHAYRYIAPMTDITKWRLQSRDAGFTGDEVDSATVDMICVQYVEAVETNDRVNDVKSGHAHRASIAAVVAVVLSLMSAVPWIEIEVKAAGSPHADESRKDGNGAGKRTTAAEEAGTPAARAAADPTDQGKRNPARK